MHMSKIRTFICLLIVSMLIACGGSDGDGGTTDDNTGSGTGGTGGGGGDNQQPQHPVLNLTAVPNTITYLEPIILEYNTERVDNISLSDVSEYLSVTLDPDQKNITVELISNVTDQHGFTINYSNSDSEEKKAVGLESSKIDGEPAIYINGSNTFSYMALDPDESLTLDLELIVFTHEYEFDISSSDGIDVEASNSSLVVSANQFALQGESENITLTLTDTEGRVAEQSVEVGIGDNVTNQADQFCFVGYCDDSDKVERYINQENDYVNVHFTGFENNQLIFNYAINPDFGGIESISFSSDEIENGSVSIDQSEQTVILNLVQATHKESEADITFSIRNSADETESVTYTVYFLRSIGGRILLAPVHKPVPVIEGQQVDIPLSILDNNIYPEGSTVELIAVNDDLEAHGVAFDLEGDTVTVAIEDDFFDRDDYFSEAASVNREILYRIKLPDGEMVSNKSFYTPINLRLMTQEFADIYEQVESEFNTLADQTIALMEIDLAILFFDKVFSLNNFEKPHQGDVNRFLTTNNAGDIDNINYIKRVLSLDNGLPVSYKGFDNRALEEIREQIIDKSDNWWFGNNREARYNKVELLSAYIADYNNLTGSTYATVPLDYFDNSLNEFNAHYSYFKGNNAYGEYVDGQFIFNHEYKYLQGLAASVTSYLSLLIN